MSVVAQKLLTGILGLALLASAIFAGVQDARLRKREHLPPTGTDTRPLGPELQAGLKIFEQFSCATCHGQSGKNGAPNYNAQTSQRVPELEHVADTYTRQELIDKIRTGVPVEPKLDPTGPDPPLHMPGFGTSISGVQMDSLIIYLYSLKPKGEDLGF